MFCRILKNIRNFVADTIVRVNSIPKEMTVLMADTVRYVSGKGGGSILYVPAKKEGKCLCMCNFCINTHTHTHILIAR